MCPSLVQKVRAVPPSLRAFLVLSSSVERRVFSWVSVSRCHVAKTIRGYAHTSIRDGFVFLLLYCCPSLTLLPTDSVISY